MAIGIQNNAAALTALNILNENTSALSKSRRKVAFGMKITSAKDDASGYVISERMRVQLRSLDQVKSNTQNGSALLKSAESGMQNIVDNMKTMKEIALRSANGIYTESDRKAMEKEFNSCIDEINDIAVTTNFNSKTLLDGTYYNKDRRDLDSVDKPTNMAAKIDSTTGDYTIAKDGVYTIDSSYTGTITIEAENVMLKEVGNNMKNVNIRCTNEGTNLWLSSVSISNNSSHAGSVLSFTGMGNSLHVGGECVLQTEAASSDAVIDMGQELAISASGNFHVANAASGSGAAIGTNSGQSAKNLTIQGGNLSISSWAGGAAIGTGGGGHIDNITLLDVNFKWAATDSDSAAIGCGAGNSSVGEITLSGCSGEIYTTGFQTEFGQNTYGSGSVGRVSVYDTSATFNGEHMADTPLSPLQLQTGTTSGGITNLYLNAMDCDALGLEGLSVLTTRKSYIAMKRLDSSLQYALGQTSRVGAYIQRLDYTEQNIITENENVANAESTIRDADMAKEMAALMKHNILQQTSQAMLAQVNQQPNTVLELLK